MADKKTITVPAILTRISHSKDGGLNLGFATQEMGAEEKLVVSEMFQQFGHLAFSPNEITLSDMPTEQAEDKTKTPSKRLRGVIYVLAKQRGIKPENFEAFYRESMEKLINHVKTQLDS